MQVRILQPTDAAAFQAVRLRGLAEEPAAFASSYEEELDTPIEKLAERLQPNSDGTMFGSFTGRELVGVIGVQRERMQKLSHKAFIWGMYVSRESRGQGHGALLMGRALEHSWKVLDVQQVNLGVNAHNEGALRLYLRFGFETFGTELGALRVNGIPQDEYHMACRRPHGQER
jgi:RimJ/RimL family protein N-acetyltransferase